MRRVPLTRDCSGVAASGAVASGAVARLCQPVCRQPMLSSLRVVKGQCGHGFNTGHAAVVADTTIYIYVTTTYLSDGTSPTPLPPSHTHTPTTPKDLAQAVPARPDHRSDYRAVQQGACCPCGCGPGDLSAAAEGGDDRTNGGVSRCDPLHRKPLPLVRRLWFFLR